MGREERGLEWRLLDYRTPVLTISYIDLVIFAYVAQARVGEDNFQYKIKVRIQIKRELIKTTTELLCSNYQESRHNAPAVG